MSKKNKKKKSSKYKNKLFKIIVIIILVIIIILLSEYLYINNQINKYTKEINNNQLKIFKAYNDIIEYGTTWQKEDFINNLLNKDKLENNRYSFTIDNKNVSEYYTFMNIGDNFIKVTISKEYTYKHIIKITKKISKTKEYPISVKDTQSPVITGINNKTISIGDEIDLKKDIVVKDPVDGILEYTISGEVNNKIAGTYNIEVKASDKSGNETKTTFTVTVKNQTVNSGETKHIGKTSKGYDIELINSIYYINGILIANKTYSLPSWYNPGGLSKEYVANFNIMKTAAATDGIALQIVSGFRSYNTQKQLYNNYVNRDGIANADTYSARPGHSEHQTGLAADINAADEWFHDTSEAKWLNDNCYKYGFIIRYPKGKQNITGYIYESWHLRYVGETLAKTLYNDGNWITLEEYLGITSTYGN